jgi:hypothetical protein
MANRQIDRTAARLIVEGRDRKGAVAKSKVTSRPDFPRNKRGPYWTEGVCHLRSARGRGRVQAVCPRGRAIGCRSGQGTSAAESAEIEKIRSALT